MEQQEDESVSQLIAAAIGNLMKETDEPMEVPGNLREDSYSMHETGSQTEHDTVESSTSLMKRPEAHQTLISQDTDVNSVPRDDAGMQAFMADGEELHNQSYMSSEFWKPNVSYGTHGESNETQQHQYSGESTVGNFLKVLVLAIPPPTHLENPEHNGYFEDSTLSLSGLRQDPVEDAVPISQYDEATASHTEGPIINPSTRADTEELPQKHIPSSSGVRTDSMEAFEEARNEYVDGLPDPEDKEERRKINNRKASEKSRESTKIRQDRLIFETKMLEEEIEPLEQQHHILQEKYENAKTSARHRDEFISIGNYLEIYVMPLVLKYSPENETQEENPVLINEEVNEEEKLELPPVPPAPIRHASHRRPREKKVKATNEKRSNKDASKRYRVQEHEYWKAVEERKEMLKTRRNVLKRNINFFQVCEGKRFRASELRKSILRRQYFVPGLNYDQFTKFKIARWFYSVGLTEEEVYSLYEEDKHLTLPSSPGFFKFYVSSRPDENILVVDFSPDPPPV